MDDRNDKPSRDVSLTRSGRAGSAVPRWLAITFWLLPFGLAVLQTTAAVAALDRLRLEEAAESIRNVYWLQHRFVYDGISSNVGWYGLLLAVYKFFGFTLSTAKWVRVGLFSLGLFCAADILRRALGFRLAIVPLIVCGLSPTILYFNTVRTSYGVDASYFPMCLWLLLQTRIPAHSIFDYVKMFFAGGVAMLSAESYPSFLFYMPAFALFIVWLYQRNGVARSSLMSKSNVLLLICLAAGFVVPLALSLIAVRNPQLLICDPHNHAGLFRGGGKFGWRFSSFQRGLGVTARDLFRRGGSYYFDIAVVDFRGFFSVVGFVANMVTSIYLCVVRKSWRFLLLSTLVLFVVSWVAPAISVDFVPGIRRCTGVLVAFFILFAFNWNFFCTHSFAKNWMRVLGLALCSVIPLSEAIKYPLLLHNLRQSIVYGDDVLPWFTNKPTAVESLHYYLDQTASGVPLTCANNLDRFGRCQYAEIYAAIQGYRLWNHQPAVEVKAWDSTAGANVVLRPELWVDYHFSH